MIRRLHKAIVVTGALVCAFLPANAFADKRVALVIGNSNYEKIVKLPNPANDATDVAKVLRDLDFKVIEIEDADKNQFDRKLAEFARLALDADAAMFFYAGHGIQVAGKNYLLPVDADIADENDVEFNLEAIDRVRQALDKAPNGIRIMVLDACRNNPLTLKTAERGLSPIRRGLEPVARGIEPLARGLARIDQQSGGLIVVYATQSDQVAQDGNERNSPFTSAFLKRLIEPGLEVGTLFRRVTSDVSLKTGGKQVPEVSISLGADYFLNRSETDALAWPKVRDSNDPQAFRDFLARYPGSFLVPDARHRIEQIEASSQAVKDKLAEDDARARAEATRVTAQAQENVKRLAEQVRKDEQLRLAREDADRKAREVADRLAAEKAQKELADRKAKEEADRMAAAAAENARRLAAEQAKKEEALRLAREDADRRKAEEQKLAAEKAQKELAERKTREDADRKARELAEKAAAEKAQKEAADRNAEERRLALERAAKDETDRLARLEQERVAKLEAERKVRDEAERVAAIEHEKLTRLDAEKAANEDAAKSARAEADAEAKRIKDMEAERLAADEREAEEAKARQTAAVQAERDNAARIAAAEAEARKQQEAKRLADAAEQTSREQASQEAERETAARLAREESEKRAAEQAARLESLHKDAEESARLAVMEAEHKQAQEAAVKAQAEADAMRLAADAPAKTADAKPAETTPADTKPVDNKPADGQPMHVAGLERTVQTAIPQGAPDAVVTPVAQSAGDGWMAAAWDSAWDTAAAATLPRGLASDAVGRMAALAPGAPIDGAPPAPPAAPEANTRDLVKAAQTELMRVGCLWGKINGALNDRTLNALNAYARSKGRGDFKSGGEVMITARFIEELKAQQGTVCEAPKVAARPPVDQTPDPPPVAPKRHQPAVASRPPPVEREPALVAPRHVRPAPPVASAPRAPRPKAVVQIRRRAPAETRAAAPPAPSPPTNSSSVKIGSGF